MKMFALLLVFFCSGAFAERTYYENYRRFDSSEFIRRLWPNGKVCQQHFYFSAQKQDDLGRRHFRFNLSDAVPRGVEWYDPMRRMNGEIYDALERWILEGSHEPHVKLVQNRQRLFAAGLQFFATNNGIKRIVHAIARQELPFDLLLHIEPGYSAPVSPM